MGCYQVTQKQGERCSAAKAYLTPHLGRPNLHVFTGAHTTRILTERKRAETEKAEMVTDLRRLQFIRGNGPGPEMAER